MEEQLLSKLKEGETILWMARPEPFETLDRTHKPHFIKKALLLTVVFGALIGAYAYAAVVNGVGIKLPLILFGILGALYGIFGEFLDARKLKRKTLYALTNQRMLSVLGLTCEGAEYENLQDYTFVSDEDGHVSLLCGERSRDTKPFGRRSATVCGAQTNVETGLCQGFAMYGVTGEVEQMRNILADYLPARS